MNITPEQVINEINQFLDLCDTPHEESFLVTIKKAGFNSRQDFVAAVLAMSFTYMKKLIDDQTELDVTKTMARISLTTLKTHIEPITPTTPITDATDEEQEAFHAYVDLVQRVHVVYLVELLNRFDLTAEDVANIQELKDGLVSLKQKMDFVDGNISITTDKTMQFFIDSVNKLSPTIEYYYYWQRDKLGLNSLHDELVKSNLIEPNENFAISFKSKMVNPEYRTKWKGKNTQAIFLLYKLFNGQYLNGEGLHEIMPRLFTEENGTEFKEYNLQISTSQLVPVFEGKRDPSTHLKKVINALVSAGIIEA